MNIFGNILSRMSNNVLPSQANMAQQTSLGMPIQHGIVGDLRGNPFATNADQVGLVQKPPVQNSINPFDQLRQQLGNQSGLMALGQMMGSPGGNYGNSIDQAAHNDQMGTMMQAVMAKLNPGGGGQPPAQGPTVGMAPPPGQQVPQAPWPPQAPTPTGMKPLPRSRSRQPGGNSYNPANAPPGSPDFDPTQFQGSGNF